MAKRNTSNQDKKAAKAAKAAAKPEGLEAPKTETAIGGAVAAPQDEDLTSLEEHARRFPPTIPGKVMAVTTMHKDGLESYGKQFLDGFAKHWPKDVTLLCFSEGWAAADVGFDLPDNIRVQELAQGYKEPDGSDQYGVYLHFLERFSGDTAANGWVMQKNRKPPVYAYRLDAVRFCHKVYALHKAFKMALDEGAELLLWLDADIRTFKDVPLEFLQKYLPPERDIGYLHRQAADGGLMYPECGFVIYRINRVQCQMFIDLFRQSYDTGDIFKLPEWHDSFIFMVLMRGCMEHQGLKVNSISRGGENTWHPFVNSPLAQFMDHLKGQERKDAGSSAKADVKDLEKAGEHFNSAPDKLHGCPDSPVLPSKATADMEGGHGAALEQTPPPPGTDAQATEEAAA